MKTTAEEATAAAVTAEGDPQAEASGAKVAAANAAEISHETEVPH
jgi:hypothetical protein